MSSATNWLEQNSELFSPFSFEIREEYQKKYDKLSTHPIAYSFPNLWGWREWMELEYAFIDDLCFLRCTNIVYKSYAPIGDWENVNWKEKEEILLKIGSFRQVTKELLEIWQRELSCNIKATEVRNTWEYRYNTEDIANLAGNKYRMQRNHVNAYVKENGTPDFRIIGIEQAHEILELNKEWLANHEESKETLFEANALSKIVENWNQIGGLTCGGIYLEDKLVAFSIGYELDADNFGVLYEKAKPGLRGAYPVMASYFAKYAQDKYAFVNRAEDMGDEGLRKSKTLYRPIGFEEFYIVELEK